jgi:tRNA A37 threonylcarbamoyltransferase TsaD
MGDGLPDFSFSGLKTAVTKHVRETGLSPVENGGEPSQGIKDLAASFQHVVVQSLVRTMERIAEDYYPKTLIVREVSRAMANCVRSAARWLTDTDFLFTSLHHTCRLTTPR